MLWDRSSTEGTGDRRGCALVELYFQNFQKVLVELLFSSGRARPGPGWSLGQAPDSPTNQLKERPLVSLMLTCSVHLPAWLDPFRLQWPKLGI